VNRALSAANSCLYGVCHAATVALGYSPGLGFIHTGKQLSFVYDIADLYKTEITIPIAFSAAAERVAHVESEVRHRCRDAFVEMRLLKRIVDDIDDLLGSEEDGSADQDALAADPAAPGGIWDPDLGEVDGGINYDESADGRDE
jgi:CRISPR-associated protein Cas1